MRTFSPNSISDSADYDWCESDLAQVEAYANASEDLGDHKTLTAELDGLRPSYRFNGTLPEALEHLRNEPRWVAWDYRLKNGEWTKPPFNPRTGRHASVSDPATWGTFEVALSGMERHGLAGIGLVLVRGGGICGVDLDNCISDSGSFSPLVAEVMEYAETYAERSPSGEGVRMFVSGEALTLKDNGIGVEVYTSGRYLTVTGQHIDGTPMEVQPAPRTIAKLTAAVDAERGAKNGAAHLNGKANGHAPAGDDFFRNVNVAALAHLDRWVPDLHPTARKHVTGAWRITSKDLGRGLEEDLAYHPGGIRDHGEEHGLTPVDAVVRFGNVADAKAAAFWLCQNLGVESASLGWNGRGTNGSAAAVNGPAEHGLGLDGSNEGSDTSNVKAWPILNGIATYGIVGEIGKLATANSEADPVAVMATTLAWGAAIFGRNRFLRVGDTNHHSRIFCALVGASSRARKGTSLDPVQRIFDAAESNLDAFTTRSFPSGVKLKVSPGPLSSGEGLIDRIRDKMETSDGKEDLGGTNDKRLLCIEGEFGSVLRACQRQGNQLGTNLRTAWDGRTLAPLTKHNKIVATDPHICLICHVTGQELRQLLTVSDIWNGFANRFIWLAVRRTRVLAFPERMPDNDVDRIGKELAKVIDHAHSRSGSRAELVMSNSAHTHWANVYAELTQDYSGVLGAVTSRAEAQALRLAITFAQFDGADLIELKHIEAALALWRYAFDSANYIFGGVEIDPIAQRILEALQAGPKTQDEIVNLFARHQPKARIEGVLADLQDRGRITLTTQPTKGRPRKVWSLANAS